MTPAAITMTGVAVATIGVVAVAILVAQAALGGAQTGKPATIYLFQPIFLRRTSCKRFYTRLQMRLDCWFLMRHLIFAFNSMFTFSRH